MAAIDFEQDAVESTLVIPTMDQVAELRSLVDKMQQLEYEVAERTEQLRLTSEQLRRVQEVDIPTRMQELRISAIALEDGMELTLKEDIFASIPAAVQPEAFGWLIDHGYGGIIKEKVAAVLPDGFSATFSATMGALGLEYEQKKSIHAGTLKSFAKDMLAQGKDLPDNLFTVYDFKKAVVKSKPKAKAFRH